MKYVIDFQNGFLKELEGTLEQAMQTADDIAGYTQRNIIIFDEDGKEITRRNWWGVAYDPDETEDAEGEVIQFGSFGYYGAWR